MIQIPLCSVCAHITSLTSLEISLAGMQTAFRRLTYVIQNRSAFALLLLEYVIVIERSRRENRRGLQLIMSVVT